MKLFSTNNTRIIDYCQESFHLSLSSVNIETILGRISASGLKYDVTVVFLDPDFLLDAKISAIRIHLRQI